MKTSGDFDLTRVFRILSDPTRLRLLNLLRDGEVCVCDLTDTLRVVQPKVSRHLAQLKRMGLIEARREGKWMYYRWKEHGHAFVRHLLEVTGDWMAKNAKMVGERRRLKRSAVRKGTRTTDTRRMKTREFIAHLRASPEKQLIFTRPDGRSVHSGYHLTEVKAVLLDTVDCGGELNQWHETIIQLWVPPDADNEYMTAAKFLRIFDKVRGLVPLKLDAEIRVEYGDENFFPSTYHVCSVMSDKAVIHAVLQPPATTCKARDGRMCCDREATPPACCAA
jgi:DNA-binding transcriptional ArsR family regulator